MELQAPTDWFWEGNVQAAVVRALEAGGWTIDAAADTASRARGVDVLATRGAQKLAVEVKGYPSTTYARGPLQGQPKKTNPRLQARHWLAEALFTAIATRRKLPEHELAIAVPEFDRFRTLLDEIHWALERLDIRVFIVREDGDVDGVT